MTYARHYCLIANQTLYIVCQLVTKVKSKKLNISKTVRVAQIYMEVICRFDICLRMVSLQKLYSVTFTYFLKVNNLNASIFEAVKACA